MPHLCTIIAKNYLAQARTLVNSWYDFYPDDICHVLIIDSFDGYLIDKNINFNIISLDDLKIPYINNFRFKYDLVELSTAVKPYLISYLFKKYNYNNLIYLDPDILILNNLDFLFNYLNDYDILLTPHIDVDYPEDGFLPNDGTIMKHGIFNLGFIGLRNCPNIHNFLSWWEDKLYRKCVKDYRNIFFVDQKFIDLAIVLFKNIHILRDPGCNVAYWNLHARNISFLDNKWNCNNTPLYFFHFSGYNPDKPEVISSNCTRPFPENKDLEFLFSRYRSLLVSNGYFNCIKWPYTNNFFCNGKIISYWVRAFYRNFINDKDMLNPFDLHSIKLRYNLIFSFLSLIESYYKKMSSIFNDILQFLRFKL